MSSIRHRAEQASIDSARRKSLLRFEQQARILREHLAKLGYEGTLVIAREPDDEAAFNDTDAKLLFRSSRHGGVLVSVEGRAWELCGDTLEELHEIISTSPKDGFLTRIFRRLTR